MSTEFEGNKAHAEARRSGGSKLRQLPRDRGRWPKLRFWGERCGGLGVPPYCIEGVET